MTVRTTTLAARARLAITVLAVLALAACMGEVDIDEPTDTPEPTETAAVEAPEPSPTPESTADPTPTAAPAEAPEPAEAATTVLVYFPDEGRGDPCGEVFAVEREVSAEDPIGEALVALLEGPTAREREAGYGGWFSTDTAGMLRGYRSDNGVLLVDFDDLRPVIPNASTSCGSALLLAQLDETLGQFPGIGEPRYAIEGDVAAFYEWLQRVPPEQL